MTYFIILFSMLLSLQQTQTDSSTLNISAEATVEVPADLIQFNVNINAEEDSPQNAYDLHKEREKALIELLKEYEISEEHISFQPIGINKTSNQPRNAAEEDDKYQTRQQVTMQFSDFDIYEAVQIGLIEHDFDNFRGSFSSSEAEEGKDEAIKKALRSAKEKAQLIAEESGVELGKIKNITYHNNRIGPYNDMMVRAQSESDSGLMQYPQSVTVNAQISVEYHLKDKS